jgi:hypothetical protein
MGWTVFFILFFGIAAIIPAIWSIIGFVQDRSRFWPAFLGVCWAFVLLLVTIFGIALNWGDCPVQMGTASKDAVKCYTGDRETGCKPDLWRLECGESAGCTGIPPRSFCPPGQKPTFPFCEAIELGSSVKQPWATWSDLSFIASGLWILWLFQYFGRFGTGKFTQFFSSGANPMVVVGPISITYALIVIFMGPPSQWFHASIKEWAGWFDTMSVVFWLMFNGLYVLYMVAFAMWGNGRELARTLSVLIAWVLFMILFGALAAKFPDDRLYLYFASGGLWGSMEFLYLILAAARKEKVRYRRTAWVFWVNLALLGATMTIWIFFHDGIVPATWCQSGESFPGHGIFHSLASFSTILTFFSFGSERSA